MTNGSSVLWFSSLAGRGKSSTVGHDTGLSSVYPLTAILIAIVGIAGTLEVANLTDPQKLEKALKVSI